MAMVMIFSIQRALEPRCRRNVAVIDARLVGWALERTALVSFVVGVATGTDIGFLATWVEKGSTGGGRGAFKLLLFCFYVALGLLGFCGFKALETGRRVVKSIDYNSHIVALA